MIKKTWILATTILVTGISAFAVGQLANTPAEAVNPTLANNLKLVSVSGSCNTDVGTPPTGTDDGHMEDLCDVSIDVASSIPFILVGMRAEITSSEWNEGEDINYGIPILGVRSGAPRELAADLGLLDPLFGLFTQLASFPPNTASSGIGPGTLTIDASAADANNDPGDETVTLEIFMLMPADAPLPTMTFS